MDINAAQRAPTFLSTLRFRLLPEPASSTTVSKAQICFPEASAFGARGRWRPERNNEDCSYSAGLVSRTFAVRRGDDYLQSPTSLADHVPYGTWISDGRWVRPASNTSRHMVRLANEHERASFQRTSLRPSITITVLWMSAIMVRGGWQLDCKTPPVGHSVHWTVVLDLMNAVPYRSTTKEIYNGPSVVW